MTISQQLAFSILSAPVAGADRRTLSQAWYSALYRASSKHATAPASRPPILVADRPAKKTCARPFTLMQTRQSGAQRCLDNARPAVRAEVERRAPRLALTQKIGELAAQRTGKRAAATFVLDGSRARVRVLVSASGGNVRLIAICSKKVEALVSRALAQARYLSAAAGVQLNAEMREAIRC